MRSWLAPPLTQGCSTGSGLVRRVRADPPDRVRLWRRAESCAAPPLRAPPRGGMIHRRLLLPPHIVTVPVARLDQVAAHFQVLGTLGGTLGRQRFWRDRRGRSRELLHRSKVGPALLLLRPVWAKVALISA